MGTTELNANNRTLAKRADRLVHVVNQLIADIESDISSPGEAAFHAKHAYDALCRVDNALRDAIAASATRHYEAMARDAQQAAA
jgi:hypothetical protein